MSRVPLAERMRPTTLDEVVGQQRWIGPGAPLRVAVERSELRSLVLWGPPGCGKTTIAHALAATSDLLFMRISAVLDGVKALRGIVDRAEVSKRMEDRGTLVFVDEIHRWNKAQQDALLPHVESGLLVLVGATTENPSFELNAALRSRLQVIRLEPLDPDAIRALLERTLADPRGLEDRALTVESEALEALANGCAGDARRALDDLERAAGLLAEGEPLTLEHLRHSLQRADLRHDRDGSDHFDVVSALIKSMRGSDPHAAVYWLARMIAGGEDPMYIARRLVIFASEDVGNADPRALQVAVDTAGAVQLIGLPEGRIPLAQAVTWLACCPKSNAAYVAINEASDDVRKLGALPVPPHLRSSDGEGYIYPHDQPFKLADQPYLPERLTGRTYYRPADHAEEKRVGERLAWWSAKRSETPPDGSE